MQGIKTLISQIVKESGIEVPVRFVDTIETSDCGAYVRGEHEILMSPESIKRVYLAQKIKGNDMGSANELAKMVIYHELFHAKDRERLEVLQQTYDKAIRAARYQYKYDFYNYYKDFARLSYQTEVDAWAFAKNFVPAEHQRALDTYADECLSTYKRMYPKEMRLLWLSGKVARRYVEQLKRSFPAVELSHLQAHKSFWGQETKKWHISIPYLLNQKPYRNNEKPSDFAFYLMIYEYCALAHQEKIKEEADKEKIFFQDMSDVSLHEWEQAIHSKEEAIFQEMKRYLRIPGPCFETFKKNKISSQLSLIRMARRAQSTAYQEVS